MLDHNKFHFMLYDELNSDMCADFLRCVHRRFGKTLIFADNASWHKSKTVIEELKSLKGEIKIKHFLSYTLELNCIKTQ